MAAGATNMVLVATPTRTVAISTAGWPIGRARRVKEAHVAAQEKPQEEHAKQDAEKHLHHEVVEVTLTITDTDGNTTTQTKAIPDGPTPVPRLKQELGVSETDSLFLVKNGKPKMLADHETHNVKEGDQYEVVSKGGVS
jgi:hypothetical protein